MFLSVTLNLLDGFTKNIFLFFITLIGTLPLGLIIAFGERSKNIFIRKLSRLYVWIIRGTPLMLQLFIVFYTPGLVFGLPFRERMLAAVITFTINYSAYLAEIFKSGLESISVGQIEAGQVLGLSKKQIFFHIILFQLIHISLGPVSNEVMGLIKNTSLARVIAVPEMLMEASAYTANGLIWPLFYTGVFFLIATYLLTIFFRKLERRFDNACGKQFN